MENVSNYKYPTSTSLCYNFRYSTYKPLFLHTQVPYLPITMKCKIFKQLLMSQRSKSSMKFKCFHSRIYLLNTNVFYTLYQMYSTISIKYMQKYSTLFYSKYKIFQLTEICEYILPFKTVANKQLTREPASLCIIII